MEVERRRYKRFPLKLPVLCRKAGTSNHQIYSGTTVNVSPGGMLIEVKPGGFIHGDLVTIEFSVPPTGGLLEFGGSFSGYAEVIRAGEGPLPDCKSLLHSYALEFCQSPRLQI